MADPLEDLVRKFVADLRELFAVQAGATVEAALKGGWVSSGRPKAAKPGNAPRATKTAPKERVRRSPKELDEAMGRILAFVSKNPGSNAMAIQKALGLQNQDLLTPISKLLQSKALRKKGERRATVYFAK
jgi:hypothetical protein